MVSAPVRRGNPRALASGLSLVQADKPCSVLHVPLYLGKTLHVTGYLVLRFGYLGLVLQPGFRQRYNTNPIYTSQWVKRWPTDLADRVRSPLEANSSQP